MKLIVHGYPIQRVFFITEHDKHKDKWRYQALYQANI